VIIATGLETLILAGASDARWLLTSIAVLLILSIANVFIPHDQPTVQLSSALYGLGILSVLGIYFVAESNRSWHIVRMFILYVPALADIFISTRHNIDKIF
jgi:hypothetical protein